MGSIPFTRYGKVNGFEEFFAHDGSAENAGYLLSSAFSTACVNSAESGFTFESNRFRIFPSRPMRNLLKFHLMSPGKGEPAPANST